MPTNREIAESAAREIFDATEKVVITDEPLWFIRKTLTPDRIKPIILRAIEDSQQPVCRNPNHALVDGSQLPHEIGPSCMAECNRQTCKLTGDKIPSPVIEDSQAQQEPSKPIHLTEAQEPISPPVAAPLEGPLTWREDKWMAPSPAQKAYEFAESYAAAVSKNIREELVRLDEFRVAAETEVDLLEARADKAEARISELEQELAELRNDSTKMFGKKIAQVKRAIRSKS